MENYTYSFLGTSANGEKWSEFAIDFPNFCNKLKRISDNPCIFLEKIVIAGYFPFVDSYEGMVLDAVLWDYDCSIDIGYDETLVTFNQN